MNKKIILFIMLFVIGCASAPTAEELANADYGSKPENYQKIIKEFMSLTLKDPYSAQYKFEEPYKGYTQKGLIYGGGVDQYGWIVKAWINGKNSYGGYTGFKAYTFIFRGDDFHVVSVPITGY